MTTWGLATLEITRHEAASLCTDINHPSGFVAKASQAEAIETAASLTGWYQQEIRPDVVFFAVPLPLY